MKDQSILKWFDNTYKDKLKITKIYFYINWYDTIYPKNCDILNTPPTDEINCTKTIKLGYFRELVICGKINKQKPDKDPYDDLNCIEKKKDYYEYANTGILKSNLQKTIRRGKKSNAIRTAFHLMRLNLIEFLRRIIIISIEDSCLHKDLLVLIWFMCFNDQKIISLVHIQYFLGIVLLITNSDNLDRSFENNPLDKEVFDKLVENILKLELEKRNILMVLVIRRYFGGMKGDIVMMDNTINKWYDYLKCNTIPLHMISKGGSIKITSYLPKNELLIPSFDFHCFPKIIILIKKKHNNLSDIQIKKAIWHNSSKINIREKCIHKNDYLGIWEQISKDFLNIGFYIRNNMD